MRSSHYNSQYSNSPHCMEPEGSSLSSKQPAICSCPEPDESNPRFSIYFCKMCFNIICPFAPTSSILSFTSVFPNKALYASLVSPICYTCSACLMLHELMMQKFSVKATNNGDPYYGNFSSLQSLSPPRPQISSSALSSRKPQPTFFRYVRDHVSHLRSTRVKFECQQLRM